MKSPSHSDFLPKILFAVSLSCLLILLGMTIQENRWFPTQQLKDARKTFRALKKIFDEKKYVPNLIQEVDWEPSQSRKARVESSDPTRTGGYVVSGGTSQFLDLCPGAGCLAVELTTQGQVQHAVPYRPAEVFTANQTPEFVYQLNDINLENLVRVIGLKQLPNGDLIATLQSEDTFPYGMGIARIRRDGTTAWYRRDYSHHWPNLAPDGSILVPNTHIGSSSVEVSIQGEDKFKLKCSTNRPLLDTFQILSTDGKVLRTVDVFQSILKSHARAILEDGVDPCDPIHLNFVDVIDGTPPPSSGVANGDFLVSMRNLNALAILDSQTGDLKRLIRGSFFRQHSSHYLNGGHIILFDNKGGRPDEGASRVLRIDLATGVETTVFPTPSTPRELMPLWSTVAGHINPSADRRRGIVTFTDIGASFEIDLLSGQILTKFLSVHPTQNRWALFRSYGVDYLLDPTSPK